MRSLLKIHANLTTKRWKSLFASNLLKSDGESIPPQREMEFNPVADLGLRTNQPLRSDPLNWEGNVKESVTIQGGEHIRMSNLFYTNP